MDSSRIITHLSLCSGYDGIGLGLRGIFQNVREVAHVEIEAFPVWNLVSKMEKGFLDSCPVYTDLKTFPYERFRDTVDILSAGFPCQPFSCAGKHKADSDERHLFPYIKEGIKACQPEFVFLENVEGILSKKLGGDGWADPQGTPVLLHVLRELERIGYDATWGIFSANQAGLSHQRKRVYILGVRHDVQQLGVQLFQHALENLSPAKTMAHVPSVELKWSSTEGDSGREPQGETGNSGYCGRDKAMADPESMLSNECSFDGEDSFTKESKSGNSNGSNYVANCDCERLEGNECPERSFKERWEESLGQLAESGGTQVAWAGQGQAWWEPSRVVTDSGAYETKSQMGRMPDGFTSGVGYAELCRTSDNITDEVRMLGNGVCPPQAALAFKELLAELLND